MDKNKLLSEYDLLSFGFKHSDAIDMCGNISEYYTLIIKEEKYPNTGCWQKQQSIILQVFEYIRFGYWKASIMIGNVSNEPFPVEIKTIDDILTLYKGLTGKNLI